MKRHCREGKELAEPNIDLVSAKVKHVRILAVAFTKQLSDWVRET